MKKTNAFIAAVLAASMLTSCGVTDTAEITSAESTSIETTTATVSETDILSAESEETTTETAVESTEESSVVDDATEEEITEVSEETLIEDVSESETTESEFIPVEDKVYGGRSNTFSNDDFVSDFENALWMTATKTYVSNDDCELLFFESKENPADERIAYVGVEKATGENTTLDLFKKVDDEFADDPHWSEDYWGYKNYQNAVSDDDVLQYLPVGTAVPTHIVLFPDCGDFYYYGAATEEEYKNSEYHWTKSTDLGLTWKPDSESSTVGNFYKGSDPVIYTGVWSCDNTAIWIS